MTSDRPPEDGLLSADRIRALLIELGDELGAIDESAELFVVGGAALALGYDAREATRDIDAVFEPKSVVYEAAARIAERRRIPGDWLNDAMKGFLHGHDADRRVVIEHPALRVFVASPRYLLAMKLFSARIERDADDIAMLLRLARIDRAEEALDLVEAAYGRERIPIKTALLVESILVDRS